ncbi:MAG: hypothetical protein JNL21_28770 [Myxococcales bacterium]|nr:hypothetical protein [Myxococcales bacterium]
MLGAPSTPACALVALTLSACSVTPLASTTATTARMAEGVAVVEDLGDRWLISGSAGHAGRRDTVWRIQPGRLELCDPAGRGCRAVPTDGVPPDTIVIPRGEAPEGGAEIANAVWVRGLPQGAIRAGQGALAYCVSSEGGAACHAARFDAQREVLRGVIAAVRLREPSATDVAWVSLSGQLARCEASPASPVPRCERATFIDPQREP